MWLEFMRFGEHLSLLYETFHFRRGTYKKVKFCRAVVISPSAQENTISGKCKLQKDGREGHEEKVEKVLMLMWQKLFGAMGHLRHSGVPRIRRSGHKQTKAESCRDM